MRIHRSASQVIQNGFENPVGLRLQNASTLQMLAECDWNCQAQGIKKPGRSIQTSRATPPGISRICNILLMSQHRKVSTIYQQVFGKNYQLFRLVNEANKFHVFGSCG